MIRSRMQMIIWLVVVLLLGATACCYAWDVTEVYVRVSQDDQGNFTTWTDNPAKWNGPDATWVRGIIRGSDGQGHYEPWPVGKIVRMGKFHEHDPERSWAMFYGLPPLGYEAYFMQTHHFWGDPTGKVYVGTNFFSGINLTDIITLRYSTQVTYRRHPDELPGYTLHGQAPMIELTTDSGSSLQERTFIYKAWGITAMGPEVVEKRWQEWDCLASGGRWEQLHTSSSNCKGDWSWLLTRYTGKKLRAPFVGDYTSPSPDGLAVCNPSGTSLAVKLGAHKRDLDNPANTDYAGKGPWCLEGLSEYAFFDKVVVGVADARDGNGNVLHETRYTFDFENDTTPVPTLAAMNNAPRKLAIVQQLEDSNLFVLYGKVITTPDYPDNGYVAEQLFTIDDGSGAPVRVICPGHTLTEPDGFTTTFVRVEGRLHNYQGEDSRFRYENPIPQIHEHLMFSRPDLVNTFTLD